MLLVCAIEFILMRAMQILRTASGLTHAEVCCYDQAHGDAEVNCVSWCPRPNMYDVLATAGDDGMVNTWKISVSNIHLMGSRDKWSNILNSMHRLSMIMTSEL